MKGPLKLIAIIKFETLVSNQNDWYYITNLNYFVLFSFLQKLN